MAQSITNIHIGPARIFVGVTSPVTGNPPTALTHTSGVPSTGTEVGFTDGPARFTYNAVKESLPDEESHVAANALILAEDCLLEFNAAERTLKNLDLAFSALSYDDNGTRTMFYGGGASGTLARAQCVVLTSVIRNTSPAKYEVLVVYRCYNDAGFITEFSKGAPGFYAMKLKALADTDRLKGDRIVQYYREK